MSTINHKTHPKLIRNKKNPEWGTFGVRLERGGEWYEIIGDRGARVLYFEELKFWDILE